MNFKNENKLSRRSDKGHIQDEIGGIEPLHWIKLSGTAPRRPHVQAKGAPGECFQGVILNKLDIWPKVFRRMSDKRVEPLITAITQPHNLITLPAS